MKILIILIVSGLIAACSQNIKKPLPIAENVDLNRFMGKWYVIANIPTFIEKGAHNAIESYTMNNDGTIATTFTFNKDDFNGVLKEYNPTGFVSNESNSIWGMQFIWPFKAEYVIAYLSDDYQQTIIARSARDYLWIMARTPQLDHKKYQELVRISNDMGYKVEKIQLVPHNKSITESIDTVKRP